MTANKTAPPRVKEAYQKEVVPRLMKERNYKSVMGVPRLLKVVVNMGVGDATQNIKLLDTAMEELGRITGQKPAMRRSRKSIAAFKLRAFDVEERDGWVHLSHAAKREAADAACAAA